jgi:5-methylcytosine-specific restriction protein A
MPYAAPQHRPFGWQSDTDRRKAYQAANPNRSAVYGRRWRKLRDWYLAKHPICECGCGYPAKVVDHKTPHNNDPLLVYDVNNLEAMTKACHDKKTASRDGGFGNRVKR